MEEELYDEFGNYIGPEVDSEEEEDEMGREGGMTSHWMEDQVSSSSSSSAVPSSPVDEDMEEAGGSTAIVLHEDKKYYPSASEIYPDAETLVEEEDRQPLSEPIIAPVKTKKYSQVDDYPACSFSQEFFTGMCEHPDLIRNVTFAGAIHHGKTTFMDMLVHQTHHKKWQSQKSLRYTDTRADEQDMLISIKAQPMSLVLQNLKEKSYILNMMDTPGNVNFSDEVTASLRLSDGVVLFVDVVEGLTLQIEETIKEAVMEGLQIVLVVTKIDRLILELKMPPGEAYFKLLQTIQEVNTCLIGAVEVRGSRMDYKGSNLKWPRLCPEEGNVCFSAGSMGWCFTLQSFAKIYASKMGNFDYHAFAKRLWGDVYFNPETRKFQRTPVTKEDKDPQRSFVEFILDPLWKMYAQIVGENPKELAATLSTIGIRLKGEELTLSAKPLLKLCLGKFFGGANGFVQMVVDHISSPSENAANKVQHIYSGPLVGNTAADHMMSADSKGWLMVNASKLFPTQDCQGFDTFGRIMSGTASVGDRVKVLGEGYTKDDEEDMSVQTINRMWIYQSRYRWEIEKATPGMWVLIEGVDQSIIKTGTIAHQISHGMSEEDDLYIFKPLRFRTRSVVKVAIEPINPSELPKMLESLRKINKSYPLVTTKVEESGEHIILGTGELYLNCVLNDLRNMYADMEIKVADPVVTFCETVVETSSVKCFGETPNKKNKLTMIAQPLDKGLAEDIEAGAVRLNWPKKRKESFFQQKYEWDLLSSKSVWAFGPDPHNGPNVLMDHTLSSEVNKMQLFSIKDSVVRGFQWACREGPLCEDPIRNVKFKLLHASIADEPLLRGGGQIIPTSRRVAYSGFLLATPRLMEPVSYVEIQAPGDCVSRIYTILAKRRGHVTEDVPKPGSPLYTIKAFLPIMDSFGFETDLRSYTMGQAFCQQVFHHWQIVPGDPLDKTIALRPLEPSPPAHLAREFMVKSRRRKGLSEDISINRFFDDQMLLEIFDVDGM